MLHLEAAEGLRASLRGAVRAWHASAASLSLAVQERQLRAVRGLAIVLLRHWSRGGQLARALLRWRAAAAEVVAALLAEAGARERAAARLGEAALRDELRCFADELARRQPPAAAAAVQRQVLELQAALDAELAHSQKTAAQLVATRRQLASAQAQRGLADGMLRTV